MAAIDILMPMRDAAPWVAAAWASLRRQTFRDWRLIAVDDGSVDDTSERLLQAVGGDARLKLVQQDPLGVAPALNRGLREVSGPLTARMDADDLSLPRRLEEMWELFCCRGDLTAISSQVRMFPHRWLGEGMARYLRWQNGLTAPESLRNERFVECTVTHAATVFRSDALLEAEGWWEGDGPEDLDLFLRLHARGCRFAKIPRVLYLWREHPRRETRTSRRCRAEAFRATKLRHLVAHLGSNREVILFGRGASAAHWELGLRQRGVVCRAETYRPGEDPGGWNGLLALFCFGSPKARARIRGVLRDKREGLDYLFVT